MRNRVDVILVLIMHVFIFGTTEMLGASSYYVSSSSGDDSNAGTIQAPFNTLEKISSISLQPGDTVFFMKGDRFDGHFEVNGSGTEVNPIVLTAYGEGDKPILSGEVGADGGGDFQETVFVQNNDYLVFDGLEIRNDRKVSRAGVDDVDAYGIYILNSGTRVLKGYTFRNMSFRNVFAVQEMNDPDDFNGLEVAAVRFETTKNTVAGKEKNIQDVLMEDCYFTNLQRLGVHIKHLGGSAGVGDDMSNRNMNLVFRNNEFHYTGGTCILPIRTYNCLIENNVFNHPGASTDSRMPGRGSSVWTWRCYNTVIQYNQCLHIRGYLDSHGIHIDHENENTLVQYNFMKDCEGGFVEILGGNHNAVYRFNISVNDGWRENPNWKNSNHTLWINNKTVGDNIHYCNHSYIYNNTVYIDSAYSTAIDIKAENTYIYNNMFVAINGANMGGKQVNLDANGTELFISNNLYFGTIAPNFKSEDLSAINGYPGFEDATSYEADGFRLKADGFALDAGLARRGPLFPAAKVGVFKDVSFYASTDYFGNPVDLASGTPNVGACNKKTTGISERTPFDQHLHKGCLVYPNPANQSFFVELQHMESEEMDVQILDIRGRVVQEIQNLPVQHEDRFGIDIDASLKDGIYFLVAYTDMGKASSRFILDRSM